MHSKTKAYALLYALMLLLLISFFLASFRYNEGIILDRISNTHIHFQSSLYLQSLSKIAMLCSKNPQIQNAYFDFGDGYFGGFDIQNNTAFLYVEATNKRTSQILRATRTITIP